MFAMFIVGFDLGLWTQRDDVHHLFKGKNITLRGCPMTTEILYILISVHHFFNSSTCMDP